MPLSSRQMQLDFLDVEEQGNEHVGPVDLRVEVVITEPRPRFNGAYSDVYIGQLHDKNVRQYHPQFNEHNADVSI
jgi:hypothetical protein